MASLAMARILLVGETADLSERPLSRAQNGHWSGIGPCLPRSHGHALSTRLNGESTALEARGWRIYSPALECFTKPIGQLMIVVLLAIMTAIRCACVSTRREKGTALSQVRPSGSNIDSKGSLA